MRDVKTESSCWLCMPVVPATEKAGSGESLEFASWR